MLSALRGKLLPHSSVWGDCLTRYLLYNASCVSQMLRTFLAVTTGMRRKTARSGIVELLLRSRGVVAEDSNLLACYAPCRRVNNYLRFGGTYCLHLQGKAV